MKITDLIIIGAGPAGLFAAITAAAPGRKVIVIEKNRSAGRKLLMAGSGRCNLTHTGNIKDFFSHYGANDKFLRPALLEFKNTDLIKFLGDRGLGIVVDDNDKVFPETRDSRDVLDLLLKECRRRNVVINNDESVAGIEYDEGFFIVKTAAETYRAANLIIATGGKSYPSTGSTGEGYRLAKSLGHNIVETAPALTPVKIKDYPFGELEGIALYDSVISLFRDNKKLRDRTGDIMLTRGGLSGPGILDLSRYIKPGDTLKISLMNKENLKDFREHFDRQVAGHGKSMVKNLFDDYSVPDRLVKKVFSMAEVSLDVKSAGLKKADRIKLSEFMTAFPLIVESLGGYNIAMATKGGVDTLEIDPKTMESKIIKGLYFAGEIMDIDGDTGGYNLQAAFSSGHLAGKNAAQRLQDL